MKEAEPQPVIFNEKLLPSEHEPLHWPEVAQLHPLVQVTAVGATSQVTELRLLVIRMFPPDSTRLARFVPETESAWVVWVVKSKSVLEFAVVKTRPVVGVFSRAGHGQGASEQQRQWNAFHREPPCF